MTRYLMVAASVLFVACQDDVSADLGGTTDEVGDASDGSMDDEESEVGTTSGEPPCADVEGFCALDGLCWAREPEWSSWALVLTSESLQAMLEGGSLFHDEFEMSGGTCWPAASGGDVCQVLTECSELYAVPSSSLLTIPGDCEFEGAWSDTVVTIGGCHGVFGELAVTLSAYPGD